MFDATSDVPDPEQDAVIDAEERIIVVLAGPGSGKTRTLAHRTGHLLADDEASSALLLTFTSKAAAELKARALHAINVPVQRILACNYHSFGHLLLRSHGHLVGLEPDFEIVDEDDASEIAQRAVNMGRVGDLLRRWSRARLKLLDPDVTTRAFGTAYERAKRAEGVADFDDLIAYSVELLGRYPSVASAYGHAYPHILVDEFQDTNPAQFAIIRALLPHGRTLSVFADDDQAIFAFQHAEPAQLRTLIHDNAASELSLTTNYRSRARIVSVANALLDADESASGRSMKAYRPAGDVSLLDYDNEHVEGAAIASGVEALLADGHPVSSVAVLARNGYRLDVTVAALRSRAVPVSDWRGFTFGRPERKALAACLAVVRGHLSRGQVTRLCNLARLPASGEREVEAVIGALAASSLGSGLADLRALAHSGAPAADVVAVAAEAIATAAPELADGVHQLATGVRTYQTVDPSFTLEHVLAEMVLGGGMRPPTHEGGVRVSTIHRAKGLEWPTVYLLGLEERQLPDHRCRTPADVSEERRLCFVGICRAVDRLVVTHVAHWAAWAQTPSFFLHEMGLLDGPPR